MAASCSTSPWWTADGVKKARPLKYSPNFPDRFASFALLEQRGDDVLRRPVHEAFAPGLSQHRLALGLGQGGAAGGTRCYVARPRSANASKPWRTWFLARCAAGDAASARTFRSPTSKSPLDISCRSLPIVPIELATTAVAASILTAVHAMLTQGKPYRDLGNIYYLKRDKEKEKEKIVARLARQARELGYELQPQAA